MKYISGLFALNLPCDLETSGDWHTSALDWSRIKLYDSEKSIFKDYGIEKDHCIPDHEEKYNVANHIRAILDLLSLRKFDLISNFRNDFICNEKYTEEIFRQVSKLLPDEKIADFMHRNYGRCWRKWIGETSMIYYSGQKPLKVELSARKGEIPKEDTIKIHGIMTYNINVMAELKVAAYQQRDKIRDLYDIAFIINNYYDKLEHGTKRILRTALEYKGLEYFDYIVNSQQDNLINSETLAESFLKAYEKVGLLATEEEKSLLVNEGTDTKEEMEECCR